MWFILSLFSGLLFAVNKLIFRFALTKGTNPLVFLAAHELLAGAVLLPFAIAAFSLPQSTKTWVAALLCMLCIFLANFFAALALQKIEASIYQIIGQLRHIVVLIGAYFLFTEAITSSKVISIILIMLGVYVAVLHKVKIKIDGGVGFALLSTIAIAAGLIFAKMAAVDVAPVSLAGFSLLASGLLCYLFLFIKQTPEKSPLKLKHRSQLIIAAVIFGIFELALFTALNIGEASKVTPVAQSALIFTVLGGYIFLQERTRIAEKITGSALIAAGIVILYFV